MLDAAESLIRQTGGTDFSMRALAHAAEVSPATPYNFFGSKEGLLFSLLTRKLQSFLDDATVFTCDDPVEQVIEAADNAVSILLEDPDLLRPLYQVMLGLTDPIHHPKYIQDTFVFYRRILTPVAHKNLIESTQECAALATSLMSHFMGVLDLWVQEDINDDWFRAQINYGFIHLLWPIARGKSLVSLKKRYEETKTVLSTLRPYPSFIDRANKGDNQPKRENVA